MEVVLLVALLEEDLTGFGRPLLAVRGQPRDLLVAQPRKRPMQVRRLIGQLLAGGVAAHASRARPCRGAVNQLGSAMARPICGTVTTLMVEHFGAPSSPRDMRAFELTGRRATDDLAGRTVWCAFGLPQARDLAAALLQRLDWTADEGLSTGRMQVRADEPLRQLARRLDEMLRGRAAGAAELGRAEQEVYADGVEGGESLVGAQVRAGDVVVVHDPLSAALAAAIRERGAHALWHVTIAGGRPAEAARDFMRRFTGPIDAYVITRRRSMTAVMPGADVVARLEFGAEHPSEQGHHSRTEEVGWSALVADVVNGDRHQTVGGTRHARPGVAPR